MHARLVTRRLYSICRNDAIRGLLQDDDFRYAGLLADSVQNARTVRSFENLRWIDCGFLALSRLCLHENRWFDSRILYWKIEQLLCSIRGLLSHMFRQQTFLTDIFNDKVM